MSLVTVWLLVGAGCTIPQASPPAPPAKASAAPPAAAGASPSAAPIPSSARIQPADLEYLGAFPLPQAAGASNWEYSGQGLTYNPAGDADGPDDGFPGSLFGFGHDQMLLVSEISIPAPVRSSNLDDLPVVETLQPFADISGGLFDPQSNDLPRADLAYLPPQPGQSEAHLYFTFGWHFQEWGEPSHGRSRLDLRQPQAAGPWVFGGYSPYVSNDYLCSIPEPWASALGGYAPAGGRAREGPWSGLGPALFAFAPWQEGNPPPAGHTLQAIRPLLLYGEQIPGEVNIQSDETRQMQGYGDADHWWGVAWLTAGDKAAVFFSGTKALGRSWYGFANGVVWPCDCAERTPSTCPEVPEWPYDDRGYWAEGYQAQLFFYDPAELLAVARGEMKSWQPQPYAVLALDDILYDPVLRPQDYKRDLVGALAFDAQHDLLYLVERLADERRAAIHVFRVHP